MWAAEIYGYLSGVALFKFGWSGYSVELGGACESKAVSGMDHEDEPEVPLVSVNEFERHVAGIAESGVSPAPETKQTISDPLRSTIDVSMPPPLHDRVLVH